MTAWEQRKLGELLLERNEQAPQSDKYPLMAFIANQGITPKGDRYDRSALVNDIEGKLYKRTEKGDFIYSSNNLETGSIGLNKYGNACISPVYSIFQPSGIADSDFLGRRLVRKDFIQEMVKWRQGVIYGQWRIHEADFLRLNIAVPSVDEQRLIGKLLDNLDALITLHQRKCQYRSLYGYLSWEQRKLGELCTISKGHGYSKADIRDAGTPLILYGRLYTQYESRIEGVDTFAVEQEGSLLSKGNEVIVPASGETAEDIAVASSVRRSGIIFGGDLNVVTPVSKLDPDYTALAITYGKAHDDLAKRAQGKSVVHIHGNDIAEVEISYPSESEQNRISTVVLGLDNLITLHQ